MSPAPAGRYPLPMAARFLAISAASLVAALSPSPAADHEGADIDGAAAEELRVLAYNIHMWQLRTGELAEVIREADADLVGLNEAWDGRRNDEIAETLGYNIVYGGQHPDPKHPPKAHTVNGFYMPQVLLTKHRIVESQVFNAMAAKGHERFDPEVPIYRGGTLAVLETAAGARFVTFVLHLHPWGDGDNEEMTSMRLAEIKGILKKLEPYRDLPTLLIGDFNTRSHLGGEGGWKVTRHLGAQGFADLYREVRPDHRSDPGLTCGDGRIDYIFYRGGLAPVDCKVVTKGVFGSEGYDHSDHLAVFGILKLKPGAGTEGR